MWFKLQLHPLLCLVMAPTRKFLDKVIEASPKAIPGKRFDYMAKKIGDVFRVYQREYEGMPWKHIATVNMLIYFNGKPVIEWNWNNMGGGNQYGNF